MATPHIQAEVGEIAKTVIMPGDPLRAKYIAENFLRDAKLVNEVRGMYAYTGTYQGKPITIMASGMGMPSIGIYAYELYQFYQVENIIRIGSCGVYQPEFKLFDIILSEKIYTESTFAYTFNNERCQKIEASTQLNEIITNTAVKEQIPIQKGNTVCMDCLDMYMPNFEQFWNRIPKDFLPIASEMEAFALFYIAKHLHKKAACLMSVVASTDIEQEATSEQRQTGLNAMIQLALEAGIQL